MADYRRPLEFGVNIVPDAATVDEARMLARRADAAAIDLIGIQDHPYQWRFLDTWALIAVLLAETSRVRFFPNVSNLPLRGPAMIAKQAASLDVLSGGRFELGLGAGAFWEAIGAMGGPVRTSREAVGALEEAIKIIRLFWSGERSISFSGRHYSVKSVHPGPAPTHPMGIWVGALQPRMLRLTGRLADGWVPSLPYAPPPQIPAMQRLIDAGATEVERDPTRIRRIYNVMGRITDGPATKLLEGPPSHWIEEVSRFVTELGFDTFVFWPNEDPIRQVERFINDVVPGVREQVARARR
jgi:alkanesulfonate monooxygenase SsuD/methylene tetrahydromethanopterin reductase-like flavin-dependent oxidoreductase (luciferase family)